MKILLVLLKINSECQWHVGLAYISAVLKKRGHEVRLLEMSNYQKDKQELLAMIESYRPQIMGLSANSHQFSYIEDLAEAVKKRFDGPIFVGGVHTTLKPEIIEEEINVDGICIGEGELAFLDLVEKIKNRQPYWDSDNFWFKKRRPSDKK